MSKLLFKSFAVIGGSLAALASVVAIADSPTSQSLTAWFSGEILISRWIVALIMVVTLLIVFGASRGRQTDREGIAIGRLKDKISKLETELSTDRRSTAPEKITSSRLKSAVAASAPIHAQSGITLTYNEFNVLTALNNTAHTPVCLLALKNMLGGSSHSLLPLLNGLIDRGFVFPIPNRNTPEYSITPLGDSELRKHLKSYIGA